MYTPPVKWDETMSTGIASIDNQHKLLIEKLNILVEAITNGQGSTKIEATLNFVQQYATQHFSDEETCMHKYQCPMATSNKYAHNKFIETFDKLKHRFEAEGPSKSLATTIQHDLIYWFIRHIRQIDVHLNPCIKQWKNNQ